MTSGYFLRKLMSSKVIISESHLITSAKADIAFAVSSVTLGASVERSRLRDAGAKRASIWPASCIIFSATSLLSSFKIQ